MSLVILDAGMWAAWSFVVGTLAARRPDSVFRRDSWLTHARAWERDGRAYERLAIRRWKDRVPELGRYGGGRSKRTLPGRDPIALERFAAETRRAELVHWSIAVVGPLFALWNPWPLALAMLAYAVVANVPCIAIQRYNRVRIARMLRAGAARARGASER